MVSGLLGPVQLDECPWRSPGSPGQSGPLGANLLLAGMVVGLIS
ncbi:MAG: hypothetical protein ABIQ09_13915 [Jatrophihabitantaceae bacterium]